MQGSPRCYLVAMASPTSTTTISNLLEAAEAFGDRACYIEPKTQNTPRRSMTFSELRDSTPLLARRFGDLGVRPGDVVALVMASSIDYARCYFAAQWLGAVTTGINPRLGEKGIGEILERCGAALVVTDAANSAMADNSVTIADLDRDLGTQRIDPYPSALDDLVAIVWTSGTTARPKGALFSHRCLAAVAAGVDVLGVLGDIRLSPLPFAHVGYMTRVASEMALGITTVISPTPWKADEALAVLSEEHITVAQGVPTQWALMLDHPQLSNFDFSALRVAGTGAAKMPASRVRSLREALKVPVIVRYTSTESSLGCGTRPGDPDEVVATTVGKPVSGVTCELMGDEGVIQAPGAVGVVRLRSQAQMLGYLDYVERSPQATRIHLDDALTATVIDAEGFIVTSDLGRFDEDGNIELVGRQNELYQRGGYNVYPAEVEEVLRTCDLVREVCVLGATDDILGEVGVAFVVPRDADRNPTLAEIRDFLTGAIADYKRPDALVVLDAIPVTPMMKVDRNALRDAALAAAEARAQSLR